MIITDPAVLIIQDRFGLPPSGPGRLRFGGRSRTATNPFTAKGYAEAGIRTASERGALATQSGPSAGTSGRSGRS